MAEPLPAAVPANPPDPHQERQSPNTDAPTHTGRLLRLVRAMIDYGKQLASTLQQRTAATNLSDVTMHFGTRDIAWIIARITCGLLRATALEDRLVSRPDRPPAASSSRSAASPHAPRTAPSADRSAGTAGSKLAQMPTPADIAADIRRRPIGAVIADICRDLGIVPSNPLWREISIAVIANGGNLATLYKDINHRLFAGPIWRTAAEPSASPAVSPAFAVTPGTGPP